MDKEIADKHYRIVGKLQAVEDAAAHAESMPCDKTTHALLQAARDLLHKAVTSAWEYADDATSQGKSEGLK
jgi:hypothetical protein